MNYLGWLGDLIAQYLRIDGSAQASRRTWNLTDYFTASDDSANEQTNITLDLAAIAGEATTPTSVTGAATAIGTADVLARADHVHDLGRDPTAGDRDACVMAYDASGISSGSAYGFVIDREVAVTGGNSFPFDLRLAGTSRLAIEETAVPVSSTIALAAGFALTHREHTFDLAPREAGGLTREIRFADAEIASTGTNNFDFPVPLNQGGSWRAIISGVGDDVSHNVYEGGFRSDGSGVAAVTTTVNQRSSEGTDDTVSASASGSNIRLAVTNNDSVAKTYTCLFELYRS